MNIPVQSLSSRSTWKTTVAAALVFALALAVVMIGLTGPIGRLRISDAIKVPLVIAVFVAPIAAAAMAVRVLGKREMYAFDEKQPGIRLDSAGGVIEIPTAEPTVLSLDGAVFHVGHSTSRGVLVSPTSLEGDVHTTTRTAHFRHLRIWSRHGVVDVRHRSSAASRKQVVEREMWPPVHEAMPTWHYRLYDRDFRRLVQELEANGAVVQGYTS